jgi:hypothetical protein
MLSPKVRQHLENALLEALKNHMTGKRKKKTARRPAKKRARRVAPRNKAPR